MASGRARNANRVTWVALLGAVVLLAGRVPAQEADDAFLSTLARSGADDAVDLGGLVKLCLDVSGALANDRTSVEMLQQLVRVPEALEERVTRRLSSNFEQYGRSVVEFRQESLALNERPGSRVGLYRVLMAGQRACWNLDLYHQQTSTWGAGASDLRSILSSREACGRFRTAAFHPGVLLLVEEALVEGGQEQDEIRRLKDEVVELERLVKDLIEIDGAD